MRERALGVLVALAALGACASVPDPGGARLEGEHFAVSSDSPDTALVASWALLVERDRARLTDVFGFELGRHFTAILFRERASFERLARDFRPHPDVDEGFMAVRGEPFVAVDLEASDMPARLVLAHELVHLFVAEAWPDAPAWWNEGLAVELSHSNAHFRVWEVLAGMLETAEVLTKAQKPLTPELARRAREVLEEVERIKRHIPELPPDTSVWDRCPVRQVAAWPRSQLDRELAKLDPFDSSPWSYLLAGTVVRFLIERRAPSERNRLAPEPVPDAAALAEWLRSVKDLQDGGRLHDRFPPIDWPGPR